jgi:hypothetical protein
VGEERKENPTFFSVGNTRNMKSLKGRETKNLEEMDETATDKAQSLEALMNYNPGIKDYIVRLN